MVLNYIVFIKYAFTCACVLIKIGPPIIEPIPPINVKDGGNLSVICRVIHSFDGNYQMVWHTADGKQVNDPLSRVIRISSRELQLFVQKVTKPIDYLCVIRNSSGILTTEHVSVYLTDVPSPPRYLEIRSTGPAGYISITWTAPATDNGSPLTGYYVSIIVEGTYPKVMKIIPDTTSLEYLAGCKKINVTVTSENVCGNSSVINSIIDTRNQCGMNLVYFCLYNCFTC